LGKVEGEEDFGGEDKDKREALPFRLVAVAATWLLKKVTKKSGEGTEMNRGS